MDVAVLADILRSEWLKLRTVRSTVWILAASAASNVGLAALVAVFVPGHLSAQDEQTLDGVRLSLAGIHLSQIAVGVLGVLAISSEYGSRLILATFAAVPRRWPVLAAKATILSAITLLVGAGSTLLAYLVFQGLLANGPLTSSLADPGVLRAVLGGGLYLAVLALLGFGLGVVLRSSAGAVATLLGLLFVPPILLGVLPGRWSDTVGPYVPMNAGEQIFIATHRDAHALGPWTGIGVFALYAAVAVAAGFIVVNRRDV